MEKERIMFRFKKRSKRPKPPPILPLEYTGYHWPEREDDKDPVVLPDDWFPRKRPSPKTNEYVDYPQ